MVLRKLNDEENADVYWNQVNITTMVKRVHSSYLEQWEGIYAACDREASRTRSEMKARSVSTLLCGQGGDIDEPVKAWKQAIFVRDGHIERC